jgi:hypothetical protein
MNKEETFQKLTEIFVKKVEYHGEFTSLFFIEDESGKLKINFLNKQHYNFILKHLMDDILEVLKGEVVFDYLNLKTTPITLLGRVQDEPKQIIKSKEKIELDTIKNKTIKEIEKFLFDEGDKILESQKEIRERDENYIDNKWYYSNYGEIKFISYMYAWLQKIKEYEEEE